MEQKNSYFLFVFCGLIKVSDGSGVGRALWALNAQDQMLLPGIEVTAVMFSRSSTAFRELAGGRRCCLVWEELWTEVVLV